MRVAVTRTACAVRDPPRSFVPRGDRDHAVLCGTPLEARESVLSQAAA